jgi:hypothetical protein
MTITTSAVRRTAGWNRPLMFLLAASAVLTVVTVVGLVTDDRVLTGVPIWLKPFKFAVSFVLYAGTLAWMLSLLPTRSRLARAAAVVIVATSVLELTIIVAQVVRGQTSHFNHTTALNGLLFDIMGTAIMVLFVAHFVIGAVVLRARLADRVSATGVRLGLAVSLVGMAAAVPMVVRPPTPAVAGITGAHSVGIPDGGPGLPLVGWSTVGGDLRIGHFVGMHALQALPLLALLLTRFGERLAERTKVRLLGVAGVAYVLFTVQLTVQALRGQPLLRPDSLTLAALGLLVAGTAAAAGLVLARDPRPELALAA